VKMSLVCRSHVFLHVFYFILFEEPFQFKSLESWYSSGEGSLQSSSMLRSSKGSIKRQCGNRDRLGCPKKSMQRTLSLRVNLASEGLSEDVQSEHRIVLKLCFKFQRTEVISKIDMVKATMLWNRMRQLQLGQKSWSFLGIFINVSQDVGLEFSSVIGARMCCSVGNLRKTVSNDVHITTH
jgi:hypothetical protein